MSEEIRATRLGSSLCGNPACRRWKKRVALRDELHGRMAGRAALGQVRDDRLHDRDS